jgi:hypothetical protein
MDEATAFWLAPILSLSSFMGRVAVWVIRIYFVPEVKKLIDGANPCQVRPSTSSVELSSVRVTRVGSTAAVLY